LTCTTTSDIMLFGKPLGSGFETKVPSTTARL